MNNICFIFFLITLGLFNREVNAAPPKNKKASSHTKLEKPFSFSSEKYLKDIETIDIKKKFKEHRSYPFQRINAIIHYFKNVQELTENYLKSLKNFLNSKDFESELKKLPKISMGLLNKEISEAEIVEMAKNFRDHFEITKSFMLNFQYQINFFQFTLEGFKNKEKSLQLEYVNYTTTLLISQMNNMFTLLFSLSYKKNMGPFTQEVYQALFFPIQRAMSLSILNLDSLITQDKILKNLQPNSEEGRENIRGNFNAILEAGLNDQNIKETLSSFTFLNDLKIEEPFSIQPSQFDLILFFNDYMKNIATVLKKTGKDTDPFLNLTRQPLKRVIMFVQSHLFEIVPTKSLDDIGDSVHSFLKFFELLKILDFVRFYHVSMKSIQMNHPTEASELSKLFLQWKEYLDSMSVGPFYETLGRMVDMMNSLQKEKIEIKVDPNHMQFLIEELTDPSYEGIFQEGLNPGKESLKLFSLIYNEKVLAAAAQLPKYISQMEAFDRLIRYMKGTNIADIKEVPIPFLSLTYLMNEEPNAEDTYTMADILPTLMKIIAVPFEQIDDLWKYFLCSKLAISMDDLSCIYNLVNAYVQNFNKLEKDELFTIKKFAFNDPTRIDENLIKPLTFLAELRKVFCKESEKDVEVAYKNFQKKIEEIPKVNMPEKFFILLKQEEDIVRYLYNLWHVADDVEEEVVIPEVAKTETICIAPGTVLGVATEVAKELKDAARNLFSLNKRHKSSPSSKVLNMIADIAANKKNRPIDMRARLKWQEYLRNLDLEKLDRLQMLANENAYGKDFNLVKHLESIFGEMKTAEKGGVVKIKFKKHNPKISITLHEAHGHSAAIKKDKIFSFITKSFGRVDSDKKGYGEDYREYIIDIEREIKDRDKKRNRSLKKWERG